MSEPAAKTDLEKNETKLDPNGIRSALLAYGAWGFVPLYWKLLKHIPALEILFHRVIWSWVFYTGLRLYEEKKLLTGFPISKIVFRNIFLASILLSANWFLYIYAVNSNQVIETSLGYFINPLVNILLGVFFLSEKLKRFHKVSLLFVCLGVGILTFEAGKPPWIAFALAITFSLYGFIRKKTEVPGLQGSQVESLLMVLPTLGILYFFQNNLSSYDAKTWVFLILTGIVTGMPLLWFTQGAKKLPYYMMGFFQFIAPTIQFLTGVIIFKEELSFLKLVGFIFIWIGVGWTLVHSVFGRNSR